MQMEYEVPPGWGISAVVDLLPSDEAGAPVRRISSGGQL
jgi:hypothetical protein